MYVPVEVLAQVICHLQSEFRVHELLEMRLVSRKTLALHCVTRFLTYVGYIQ